MNESKEDTQNTKNGEEIINIEDLTETFVMEPKKQETKEQTISMPVEKHSATLLAKQDLGLKRIASEDVNPLFYEIGPFPRRPQSVWVQFMGLRPPPADGDPLIYEPSRNDFVRLVFSIVFIMLLCTCGFCLFCIFCTPVTNLFIQFGILFVIGGCVLTLILSYAFSCSACTRTFPCSFICLSLTVIGFSLIVTYFTLKYRTGVIMIAIGTTLIIVLVCLGLACTSFDFTRFILVVVVAMLAVALASMGYVLYCVITKEQIKPLHCALLALGTLVHSVSLIIEFQMVIGGKTIELSEDDYALGAYMIYSSIITIFLRILELVGMSDD